MFRNAHDWVIAFEIVAYVLPACAYEHSLYLYGNCIQGQVQWILRELPARIDVQELWDEQTGAFLARRDRVRIKWGDEWLEFTPTAQEYAAAGVVFLPDRQQTNDLEPLEVLAYLCWKLQSPFFLSDFGTGRMGTSGFLKSASIMWVRVRMTPAPPAGSSATR